MSWFNKDAQERENRRREQEQNQDDIEIKPAEMKAKLDKVDSIETEVKALGGTIDAKLKPVIEYIAKKQADEAKEVQQRQQQQRQNAEVDDTDFISDPSAAVKKLLEPTNKGLLYLGAKQVKQDVLSSKDYYYGDFKTKVDELISKQNLQNQCDPAIVENCYKVILADHIDEISKGNLKTQVQATSFAGGGAGAHGGRNSEEDGEKLSKDEELIASKMGISAEEWKKSKREMNYV